MSGAVENKLFYVIPKLWCQVATQKHMLFPPLALLYKMCIYHQCQEILIFYLFLQGKVLCWFWDEFPDLVWNTELKVQKPGLTQIVNSRRIFLWVKLYCGYWCSLCLCFLDQLLNQALFCSHVNVMTKVTFHQLNYTCGNRFGYRNNYLYRKRFNFRKSKISVQFS